MRVSEWKTALIDVSEDDDLSAEVDLGGNYEFLTILIPTLTSSTITIHVSNESGGTFYPVYVPDADATGDFAHATSAATTSHAVTFRIGGTQYIKIAAGSAQAADRSFKVRGFNQENL